MGAVGEVRDGETNVCAVVELFVNVRTPDVSDDRVVCLAMSQEMDIFTLQSMNRINRINDRLWREIISRSAQPKVKYHIICYIVSFPLGVVYRVVGA